MVPEPQNDAGRWHTAAVVAGRHGGPSGDRTESPEPVETALGHGVVFVRPGIENPGTAAAAAFVGPVGLLVTWLEPPRHSHDDADRCR